MNKKVDVLERSVLQPGKPFIREGEENIRAYVVQNGEVQSYIKNGDKKVKIAKYGPGTIIGELGLMVDTIPQLSYEATTTTTVVTVTRQDFQKRLARADKTIRTILDHAIKKLENYETKETKNALKSVEVDAKTELVMEGLLQSVPKDNQDEFRNALMPHIDGIIKEMKKYKK
ncbi:MAG: cyclic nucleotide-binding domain-containing protein [Alphaproteobacteria bacterium]